MKKTALLALANGEVFTGLSVGIDGTVVGEVVFNTALSGYQEILTDPSYARQLVTLTVPHVGNVGCNPEDMESQQVWAAGLIVRDFSSTTSSWRATMSLSEFLQQQNVVAIADIDTRHLTHIIREHGAQSGCLTTDVDQPELAIQQAQQFSGLAGLDLAQEVTTTANYAWPSAGKVYHVVVYDYGVKHSILRLLAERDCRITVVPAKTKVSDVLALKPDGVLLSNGPGDPQACDYAIEAIRQLLDQNIPLFGICLGFQLLALACGAQTEKMKFGHHGANHPVRNVQTGLVSITSQNHGFMVTEDSLPADLTVTHRSLFDGSLQGFRHQSKPVLGFQGHPEASPGPHDIVDLFDQFIGMIAHPQATGLMKNYAKTN